MFLHKSNRMKHFWAGAFIALFTTVIGAIVAGGYKEFKDKTVGTKFDWLDWLATILGGLLGNIVPLVAYIIYVEDDSILSALAFAWGAPLFVLLVIGAFDGFGHLWSSIKKLLGK